MSWRYFGNRNIFSGTPAFGKSKIHYLSRNRALCFSGNFAIFELIAGTFLRPGATCIVDINNEKQIQD